MMDWSILYFGPIERNEIQAAVDDAEWQSLRKRLKGKSLETKYAMLEGYYNETLYLLRLLNADESVEIRLLQVRVTNYVTALSRGGLIKVEDYRKND